MTRQPARPNPHAPDAATAHWSWWAATSAYFVVIVAMHLQFSLWLVRPRELPGGRQSLSELVAPLAALGALALAIVVVRQLRRSPWRWTLAGGWLLAAMAVYAIDRTLTFSFNEVFHYPQYAALAWLVARTLDPGRQRVMPGRVLFWTTLLGAVDELLQYLWITSSYSHYFDFNDVVVNFVAAAGGTLLYYGAGTRAAAPAALRRPPKVEAVTALVLVLLVASGLWSGRLQATPAAPVPEGGITRDADGRRILALQRAAGWHGSWQDGPRRGRYYVLQPVEGLALLAVAAGLVAAFGRRTQRAGAGAAAATIPASSASKSR